MILQKKKAHTRTEIRKTEIRTSEKSWIRRKKTLAIPEQQVSMYIKKNG
jgi:hypothetical protein